MSLFLGIINWLLRGTLSSGAYCDMMVHENKVVWMIYVCNWFLQLGSEQ